MNPHRVRRSAGSASSTAAALHRRGSPVIGVLLALVTAAAGLVNATTTASADLAAAGTAPSVRTASTLLTALTSPASNRGAHAKPTIVLVHGAFADASGWSAEIALLQRDGFPVIAPASPLRGLSADADYIRSILGGPRA